MQCFLCVGISSYCDSASAVSKRYPLKGWRHHVLGFQGGKREETPCQLQRPASCEGGGWGALGPRLRGLGNPCSHYPPRHPLLLTESLGSCGWDTGSSHLSLSRFLQCSRHLGFLPSMLAGAQVSFGKILSTVDFPKSCSLSQQQSRKLFIPDRQSTKRAQNPQPSTAPYLPELPNTEKQDPHTLRQPKPTRAHICPKLWGHAHLDTFSILYFKPPDNVREGKHPTVIMREPPAGKLISSWRKRKQNLTYVSLPCQQICKVIQNSTLS